MQKNRTIKIGNRLISNGQRVFIGSRKTPSAGRGVERRKISIGGADSYSKKAAPMSPANTPFIRNGDRRAPCFIVAEMSGNHDQSFEKAVSIIKAAARAGADAIKLQTYTPDTMTIDSKEKWFWVGGKENPKSWKGQTFYDLYKKAYTPWEWFPKLKKIAENLGLIFFSTPFDATAVDFLERLKMPAYKIAAYESIDVPLLRKVAKTGKPIIVSVGFSTLEEVRLTVETLKKARVKDIIILHCTTSYKDRAIPEKTNLKTMLDIKKRFGVLVGLSDNMGGIEAPELAALLGASVIEKHLVLKHGKAHIRPAGLSTSSLNGRSLDDRFSLDEKEFKKMVDKIRRNEAILASGGEIKLSKIQEVMLGKPKFGPQTPEEKYNRNFRRSLFVVADIKKGEKFNDKNIRSIRPGYGLPPKYFDKIIGRKAKKDIKKGTPLSKGLVS